jgi:hypothetical protein
MDTYVELAFDRAAFLLRGHEASVAQSLEHPLV